VKQYACFFINLSRFDKSNFTERGCGSRAVSFSIKIEIMQPGSFKSDSGGPLTGYFNELIAAVVAGFLLFAAGIGVAEEKLSNIQNDYT
jgi:hypothetical protein